MQRRASTTYGSVIAPVGQARMQSVQDPHRSVPGSSGSRSSVVRISPKRSHDPYCVETRFECFPIQPSPACWAHAFSITGPVST